MIIEILYTLIGTVVAAIVFEKYPSGIDGDIDDVFFTTFKAISFGLLWPIVGSIYLARLAVRKVKNNGKD